MNNNKKNKNNIFTKLAPLLGAGAIGVCPICWIGSASFLTYVGLGVLIPVWKWIVLILLGIGFIGFLFDYKSHKNPYPTILLIVGGIILYVGRYVFAEPGFGKWQIWGIGAILIIVAVLYNRSFFKKLTS